MERITDAETAVMMVLWQDSPLTAQDIMDRVPAEKGWSANTVKTLLARLVAKKAIAHKADGRRYLYHPLIAHKDYVAGESRLLIDRLFGGRLMPLVAHFVERDAVSAEEIAEIQALLRDFKA
ncbi:MAG: BlaI/MecI/CopY family transcriptional regulator [Sphingomonas sp.]|uniref:BlaI/MecI/CopY family transcriptional regulator n=1 Tax=Sphingomonas sp. TaxID=28214 RepID=UPI00261B4575|nr:BlaI/MecI/CopY family transcriptional regulator [Sphingomonas sp.]MDK2770449.1 BlaI/MecI/CopY family transcriptional regulator [Sphingomonas sp.]